MSRKLYGPLSLCALVLGLPGLTLVSPSPSLARAEQAPEDNARLALALERRRLVRADANLAQREDRQLAPSRVVSGADLRRLTPEPGELLSVTEKRFRALEFNLDPPAGVKGKKVKSSFVARGVAFDSVSGLLAIAAVSRVLLFDVAKTRNNLTELASPAGQAASFGFANDVLFDGRGGLIIADQGATVSGQAVVDGRLWRYDLETGEFTILAPRKELFNPKLLARDTNGNVYFVDGEGGPLMTPLFPDRWDSIWRITGKKLTKVKRVWNGVGIQATAFDVDPAGRYWFANLAELALIVSGVLRLPCPFPLPFEFATGLIAGKQGTAFVLDGADVRTTGRWLYGVDLNCTTNEILFGSKLAGSRGLANVEAAGS